MTALLSIFLQVETLFKRFEIFGAFGVVLIMMTFAVIYLVRKNDKLEKENKEITEKTLEAIILANKVMDDSHDQGKELKTAMEALRMDVLTRSCKYNGGR